MNYERINLNGEHYEGILLHKRSINYWITVAGLMNKLYFFRFFEGKGGAGAMEDFILKVSIRDVGYRVSFTTLHILEY